MACGKFPFLCVWVIFDEISYYCFALCRGDAIYHFSSIRFSVGVYVVDFLIFFVVSMLVLVVA